MENSHSSTENSEPPPTPPKEESGNGEPTPALPKGGRRNGSLPQPLRRRGAEIGASPGPYKGGEQKRKPPPAPPKEGSRNGSRLACTQFVLPSFGGVGGGFPFSVQKCTFFSEIRCVLQIIRELLTKLAAFYKFFANF